MGFPSGTDSNFPICTITLFSQVVDTERGPQRACVACLIGDCCCVLKGRVPVRPSLLFPPGLELRGTERKSVFWNVIVTGVGRLFRYWWRCFVCQAWPGSPCQPTNQPVSRQRSRLFYLYYGFWAGRFRLSTFFATGMTHP